MRDFNENTAPAAVLERLPGHEFAPVRQGAKS